MVEEKIELIEDYGVPIEIRDSNHNTVVRTKALIGKASTGNITERSLEYHKKSQVPPSTPLTNGMYMINEVTKEVYIPIANMDEVIDGQRCAIISRLVECNSEMTLFSIEEDGDDNGNLTIKEVYKYKHLPVHIRKSTLGLEHLSTGYEPKSVLEVISPVIKASRLDTVVIALGNGERGRFKVEATDFNTQPDVCILTISEETRNRGK